MVESTTVDDLQDWIPNIIMGKDYDRRYAHAPIHYESLENLAGFFSRNMPVHRHAQYLQIHYVDSGQVRFHIDDGIYYVTGPTCFLTPPSVPHSFLTQDGSTGHVLTIHQSLLWRLLKDGLQQQEAFRLRQGICLNPSDYNSEQSRQWSLVGQIFQNIKIEWTGLRPAKTLMLETLSRLLIIQIARLSSKRAMGTKANSEGLNLFRTFTDLVEDNYARHLNLQAYTTRLAVSESKLNRVCQNISNSSPKILINERLLQEVRRLLIFSNLTSKEICFQLCFSDPAYFSRFFKRHTGLTARQYRASCTMVSPQTEISERLPRTASGQ